MDEIAKFLRKLDKKMCERLIAVMTAIGDGKLTGLDIKPLQGRKGWYRCRLGDIRIIFVKNANGNHLIIDVDFRGSIYKKK